MSHETIYNGSIICEKCGQVVDPVTAMYSPEYCANCQQAKRKHTLKERMAP
jgi:hypothetical protein